MKSSTALPLTLGALALLLLVASLFAGDAQLSGSEVVQGLFGDGSAAEIVIRQIRLPRAILAALVGGALGLAGAALQGFLRNPLAEPGVIGVSPAASLGAVLALYFGWAAAFPLALPLAAMTGALASTLILVAIASRDASVLALILAGAAISSLAMALTALAMNLAPNPYALSEIVFWLMGTLKDRSFDDVAIAAPFIAAGAALLLLSGRGLNALSLGEDVAHSLGVSVRRLGLIVVLGVTLAVGAATASAGAIGFVGLVVPHLLRPWAKYEPRRLLIPSALGGAALVQAADIAVRVLPVRPELMLGVLTAIIGAPFFLHLIFTTRRVLR